MSSDSNSNQGCPVEHNKAKSKSKSVGWFSLFRSTPVLPTNADVTPQTSSCPVKEGDVLKMTTGCPVKHDDGTVLPPSLEEAARHAQSPHPDQRIPLSTHRVISSIPRADDVVDLPFHQPAEVVTSENSSGSNPIRWVYPSEQQFYNAMKRKGWEGVDERTIPDVVRIHNAVNEGGWSQVQRWEQILYQNSNPRLVKFVGRPKDTSPRAWFLTNILWYRPPFDRHDWYVDAGSHREESPRRYVIDFYEGTDLNRNDKDFISFITSRFGRSQENGVPPSLLPSIYLDVRPAIDSPKIVFDRFKMFAISAFPGIYAAVVSRPPTLSNGSEVKPRENNQTPK
jgi:cytochrome c heme-lyase